MAATVPVVDQTPVVKYDGVVQLKPSRDTWYVVMAMGVQDLFPVAPGFDDGVPRAITNPIYVDTDGNGIFDAPGIIPCASPC
ncbi:MAG TPA: hypothetical protein VM658_15410 [bacterium]|nr:hypothetical protein [bacterium]